MLSVNSVQKFIISLKVQNQTSALCQDFFEVVFKINLIKLDAQSSGYFPNLALILCSNFIDFLTLAEMMHFVPTFNNLGTIHILRKHNLGLF